MDKLKVGVIGAGWQGQNHAQAYSELEEAELIAIADINKGKTQKVADCFEVKEVYTDYTQMLTESEVEAVSITTPDFLHKEPAIYALEKGKHVLCEKPLATSLPDVDEMVFAAEKSNRVAMACFENRWNLPFVKTKEAIDRGEIGKPITAYARLNVVKKYTQALSWADKTSVVFQLMVHSFDLIRWFTKSEVKKVSAEAHTGVLQKIGIEGFDAVHALISFNNGTILDLESCWILPNNSPTLVDFKVELIGSKGAINIDTSHQCISKITEKGLENPEILRLSEVDGTSYGFVKGMIRHFVYCIRKKRIPLTTFRDGRAAVEVASAIHKSIREGKPVYLPSQPVYP